VALPPHDQARLQQLIKSGYAECYGSLHNFKWRGARVERKLVDGVRCKVVTQMCQDCPKIRTRVYRIAARKGDLDVWLRSGYNKVQGYDAEPGEGRLPRADIEQELIRRAEENDWT
jgi:hypothetical protein